MKKYEFARKFGEDIRRQREQIGVSQADLAKDIGVSPAAVSGWELGKSVPNAHMVSLIQDFVRRQRARQCGVSAAGARQYAQSIAKVSA